VVFTPPEIAFSLPAWSWLMFLRSLAVVVCAAICSPSLMAGEFNTVLNIGDKAPAWVNLPGVDGEKHSQADLPKKKLAVVVFTCNSCPIAVDYEDRLIAFAEKHAAEVSVTAINVNRVPADLLPKMKLRAEEKGFNFAYLFDESQQIAKQFGATGTPEFFLLSADRKVIYMGAMDDSTDAAKVKHHYLEDAVQAALAGKSPEVKESFANGCRIRYARVRRKKN